MSRQKEVKLTRRQLRPLSRYEYTAWREGNKVFCDVNVKGKSRKMIWDDKTAQWRVFNACRGEHDPSLGIFGHGGK